jgi:hypothetical protein
MIRGDCVDNQLDRALASLKAAPLDRRLDQLEPQVWARIEAAAQRRDGASLFLPVRAAGVAAALVFGVALGGVGASEARAERQEVSAFSLDIRLAPSTLLEGR